MTMMFASLQLSLCLAFIGLLIRDVSSLVAPSAALSIRTSGRIRLGRCGTDNNDVLVLYGEGTGGWGIGNSREMLPEEFRNRGDRRAFEGYQLSNRGDFMRQVERDASAMVDQELDELMGVAQIAGIRVKDPSTRLNKFGDQDLMDDDDLDLSVPLED